MRLYKLRPVWQAVNRYCTTTKRLYSFMKEPASSYRISYNDITRHNFKQMKSKMLKKIQGASHIAVDLEFSAIGKNRLNDPIHVKYSNIKRTVEKGGVFSIGLSVVTKIKEGISCSESNSNDGSADVKYECDNFNITTMKKGSMLAEHGALEFLVQNGFDLNKVYRDGVPYTDVGFSNIIETSTQKSDMVEDQTSMMTDLWTDICRSLTTSHQTNTIPTTESPPNLIIHNGLFDLMYIHHSFIKKLPETMDEFLMNISNYFPNGVFDTKHLTTTEKGAEEYNASFLAYVFAKSDRLRQNRFGMEKDKILGRPYFKVEVKEPLEPSAVPKNKIVTEILVQKQSDNSENDDAATKKKLPYCENFTKYGYCRNKKHDRHSPEHDVQVVLDREMSPSPYPQHYTSDPSTAMEEGYHAAHFDAYMTAFSFCYLKNTLAPEVLREEMNKIKTSSKEPALVIPCIATSL